jgi:hypothetical protein
MWRTVGGWIEKVDPEIADVVLDALLAVLIAAAATNILQWFVNQV